MARILDSWRNVIIETLSISLFKEAFTKCKIKKDGGYKTQTRHRLNKMRNPIAPRQQKHKMLNVAETLFISAFDCFKTFNVGH